MNKAALLLIPFLVIFFISISGAAIITVTPEGDDGCTGLECSIQNALTEAAENGESDTVIIEAGIYEINSTLEYYPVSDNGSLEIVTTGPVEILFPDGIPTVVFSIDTTGLLDDSTTRIDIAELNLVHDLRDESGIYVTGLYVHTDATPIYIGKVTVSGGINLETDNASIEIYDSISTSGTLSVSTSEVFIDSDLAVVAGGISDASIAGFEISDLHSGNVTITLGTVDVLEPSLILFDQSVLQTGTITMLPVLSGIPDPPVVPDPDDSENPISDPTGSVVTVTEGGGQTSGSGGGGCFIKALWGPRGPLTN
jgi:hypothetical protein